MSHHFVPHECIVAYRETSAYFEYCAQFGCLVAIVEWENGICARTRRARTAQISYVNFVHLIHFGISHSHKTSTDELPTNIMQNVCNNRFRFYFFVYLSSRQQQNKNYARNWNRFLFVARQIQTLVLFRSTCQARRVKHICQTME